MTRNDCEIRALYDYQTSAAIALHRPTQDRAFVRLLVTAARSLLLIDGLKVIVCFDLIFLWRWGFQILNQFY